ncbi:Fe-S cluster assembly protein SufD [Phenylobacterium terrae]|uniref:Fe-S cluster assembly protein SufD n=1 Tax=Phenylobacterium terrae TaxID=2665495 RepID=A0ABW4N4D9_9CAUL
MTLSAAIRTGDVAQLPGKRDEDWRWTDLRGLIRVLPPASPAFAGEVGEGPFGPAELTIVNGQLRGEASALIVPAGESRTVRLRFVSASAGTSHGVHLGVEVADGASLILLESYEGRAADYVADAVLTVGLGEGASLERIVLTDDDAGAVSVSTAIVTLGFGARLHQTVLAGGAKRQRIETRVNHPGHGAEVRLDGVYLLAGQRHADQTTVVTHEGLGGVTDQLTKGVVRDQARGVFQGRIVVAEGADKTDARMGHHALILSERAEVDAKPELEIYADDVACAHGNTVGALDEDALFYIRQRGVPEAEARALLTEAFVGEVVERIEHEAARAAAAAWVAQRLGG